MSQQSMRIKGLVLIVVALTVGAGWYYFEQTISVDTQSVSEAVSETQPIDIIKNPKNLKNSIDEKENLSGPNLLEMQEQLELDRYRQAELEQLIDVLRLKRTQSDKQIEQRLNKINELKPLLETSAEPAG